MNKEEFTEQVLLSLYGELDEDQEKALTGMLSNNPQFIEEYRKLARLYVLAGEAAAEVPEDLIQQARENLGKVLAADRVIPVRAATHGRIYGRSRIATWLGFNVFSGWARYAAGLAGGLLLGFLLFKGNEMLVFESIPDLASLDESTTISNVSFVPVGDDEKTVELSFSATRDYRFTDSIDNPAVQRMLAYSLIRESNPGIRIRTVGVLTENADAMDREEIKNALLTAVATDENPVVRGQALDALKKYPGDQQIQGTLVNVLRFDKNSKLRMEAVKMLSELVAGGKTLPRENIDDLKNQAKIEENLYLKNQLDHILEKISLEQL